MRLILIATLGLLVTAPAFATTALPVPQDELTPLLEKLALREEAFGKIREKLGVTVTTIVEELDRKGRVSKTSEAVYRQTWKDGKQSQEIVRYIEDGKDITKKKLAKAGKDDGKKANSERTSLGFALPFAREDQKNYVFALKSHDDGKAHIAFKPRGPTAPDRSIGEAVVDLFSGELESVAFKPSENPKHVSKLRIEMQFAESTPIGKALSTMKAEGEGGFLLMRKRMRVTATFSDYVLPGDPGSQKTGKLSVPEAPRR